MTPRHVAIVTADRPAAVRRAVDALSSADAPTHGAIRVHVFDNGRSPSAWSEVKALCRHVTSSSGAPVDYVGADDRTSLARALVKRGCDPNAVSFALETSSPPSIGANRNTVLLSLAGERFISLDDDVVPTAVRHESFTPGVELARRPCPHHIRFGRVGDLAGAFRPCSDAWTDAHRHLGRPVVDVLDPQPGRDRADDERALATAHPYAVARKRVRIVVNGFIGYDVSAAPTYLLFAQRDTRAALHETEESYRRACADGWTSRFVPKAALTLDPSCLTTCCGIDNATLLPPFFPSCRGEDTLWAGTLARCDPSAATLYVPETVYHLPVDPGRRRRVEVHQYQRPLLLNVLEAALASFRPKASTIPRNLDALGRDLIDWTGASVRSFRHGWVETWRSLCRARLGQIDLFRSMYRGSPAYWDHDILTLAAEIRLALTCIDNALPRDLGSPTDNVDGWPHLRELIRQFGGLLQHWAPMWETARDLRSVSAFRCDPRGGLHYAR